MKSTLQNHPKSNLVKLPFLVNLIFAVSVLLISSLPSTGQTTVKTVGSGGDYATLKMAFDAINAGGITGNIELQLISNQTGITTSAVLNESGVGGADYTAVAIYPTVSNILLQGNLIGAIIRLDGADNVTIDGRVNRTGDVVDLTIQNQSTNNGNPSGNVGGIVLINGATNNIIRYTKLIFHGGNVLYSAASLVISNSTSTTGNNDNVIEYCHFTGGGAGATQRAAASIWAGNFPQVVGTPDNEGVIIRHNHFYDNFKFTSASRGIHLVSQINKAFTIEENSFYQTASFVPSANTNHAFISFEGSNHLVRNNYIGGSGPGLSGTFTINSYTASVNFTLFSINVGTNATGTISGNKIGKFDVFIGGGFFDGILVSNGASVTVSENEIGSLTTVDNIQIKNSVNSSIASLSLLNFTGIRTNGTLGNVTITGNKIGGASTQFWNPSTNSASNDQKANLIGIHNQRGSTVLIAENTIGGIVPNSLYAKSLSTNTADNVLFHRQLVIGILHAGSGSTTTIRDNVIQNLVNASQNVNEGYVQGIQNNSSSGTANITGNRIENLKISNNNKTLGSLASVVGISSATVDAPNVTGNTISGLTNDFSDFEGEINGIAYASLNGRSITGNFIKEINPDASQSATVNGIRVELAGTNTGTIANNLINFRNLKNSTDYRGISDLSTTGTGTVAIYFNTIVFSGNPRTSGNSHALYSNSAQFKNYRNNNLYNAIANTSGIGINAALGFGPTATLPAAGALDYNNYFVTGSSIGTTQFLVDNNGTTYTDLASWQTASSRDANSLNLDPQFNNVNGSQPTNFRVNSTSLAGITTAGITTDHVGITRAATPTIGALEYCVEPIITTFTPDGGISGNTVTITGINFSGVTVVKFNGINASAFTVNSATEIVATVPPGNFSGKISLTNACGTVESAQEFTFHPKIWYVKNDATGDEDGSSWIDAFTTIQAAVDAANGANGDIIVVARGTYTSSTNEVVLINPSKNFSGVKMYGGYAGNEVLTSANLQLAARNFTANASVIDGQDLRRGILMNGFTSVSGLNNETLIDGFTIQKGYTENSGFFAGSGGGLLIYTLSGFSELSPVFRNINFKDNFALYSGGAVQVYFNFMSGSGGSDIVFDRVLFHGNSSIEQNSGAYGGAINFIPLSNFSHSLTILNSIFDQNEADYGGALSINRYTLGSISVINSTFFKNKGLEEADVLFLGSGFSTTPINLINSIFVENAFGVSGGGGSAAAGSINIQNSLVQEPDAVALNVSGWVTVGADILYGATATTFEDAVAGDFNLAAGSPAIDAGLNSALPAGFTKDFAGNDRIFNSIIDMGALEFSPAPSVFIWTAGNSNQNGNEGGNWNNGVPPAGSNIRIPDGAVPYPVFDFNFQAGDIELEGDATLTIAPNRVLTFAAGKGASRPVGGTGKIILKSDPNGDASIGNLTGAGSVGVPVVQERYVAGGNRAFRFFSHPYTTAIPLSVLANVIDVTGTGGSANGFTTTDTNLPSAFRFSPISSDGSETSEDAGWIPFTNTNQTIGRWEAIRILFRGSKGQANSLLDVAYAPDPVTIEWEGTINQGTQVIPLEGEDRGAAGFSDWNLVGNPFPSAITLTGATHSVSNGLDYAVWRPRVGNGPALNLIPGAGRGGLYVQEPLSTGSIIIPSGGGFFIRAGGTSATFTIPEPAKITATTAQIANLLRQSNEGSRYGANTLQIQLTDGEEYLDRVLLFLNAANKGGLELEDAPKMANPAINFFTVSEDDWALAIDRRPYNEQEGSNRIPLHILAPAYKGYTLSLPDFDLESNNTLRLYDRFTDTYHELNQDFRYSFEVTGDPRSRGHRFDIVMGVEVVTSLETLQQNNLNIFLIPNPAEQQVAVTIQRSDVIAEARVRILDSRGVQLYEARIAPEAEARIDYLVSSLPKGVYLVEVVHGTQRMVKRLLVK
jgi:hypothetical protein